MVLSNHNVGRVFLEGEGEEGPELKGSVTDFALPWGAERFKGITTHTLTIYAT